MPDEPVTHRQFETFETRLFDYLERQFQRIDVRFDGIDARFNDIDSHCKARVEALHEVIHRLEQRLGA